MLAILLIDNVGLQAKLARLLGTFRRQAASERRLRTERESLFSAVVESSNDAIITKLLDGTITGWNGAAERLFGFTAAEAIGKNINIIVRRTGATRYAISSNGSTGASRLNITRRHACARMAAPSMSR